MATPRKVGSRWRIEKQVNGRKLSSYHDTKQEAINWAIESEVVHSGRGYIKGRTMGMLLDKYQAEIAEGRKGERWDVVRIKTFKRRWKTIPVDSFKDRDIELWRDERLETVQPSTFNRELNLLSAIMTKAVKWRWARANVVYGIDRPKDPPHRDRIISKDEQKRLIEAMGVDPDQLVIENRKHELGVIFLIALSTGMRLGEITGLDWRDINTSRNFLNLPDTKNGTSRNVPLSSSAVRYLRAMGEKSEGRVFRISRDIASNYFRDIRRSVGIEDIVFHDARHTAITDLAQIFTPMELARAVGHKKLDMTLRYFNAHASDLAKKLG